MKECDEMYIKHQRYMDLLVVMAPQMNINELLKIKHDCMDDYSLVKDKCSSAHKELIQKIYMMVDKYVGLINKE